MKVVAIIGGLGSQMIKYAFYLDLKKKIGDEKIYIDTTPYQLMEMWNGYELNRIFGIEEPDFYKLYVEADMDKAGDKNYRMVTMDKMHELEPDRPLYCTNQRRVIKYGTEKSFGVRLKYKLQTLLNQYWFGKVLHDDRHIDKYKKDYWRTDRNTYYDEFNHTSDEYFRDVKEEVIKAFEFPAFTDERNRQTAEEMLKGDSVALHVRRSDHMYDNIELFNRKYFAKSVNLIREHATKPYFYIFSEDLDWCKENLEELGLTKEDQVTFVDWNKEQESFRDMQLMTYCKHNVMAISSFSWWGCYLSKNKEGKVACAPNGYWFDVENHF